MNIDKISRKPEWKLSVKDQLEIIAEMLYELQCYNEDVGDIQEAIDYSNLNDKIREKIREISLDLREKLI